MVALTDVLRMGSDEASRDVALLNKHSNNYKELQQSSEEEPVQHFSLTARAQSPHKADQDG